MKFEAKAGIIDYQDSEYKNIELPLREFINKYEIESAYQLLEDSFNKLTIRDYLFNLHTLFLANPEKFIPEFYGLKLFKKLTLLHLKLHIYYLLCSITISMNIRKSFIQYYQKL